MTRFYMPFGKYKGQPIEELPDDYLSWLYSLDDLRERTRAAVDAEWERRQDLDDDDWAPSTRGVASPKVRALATELIKEGYRVLTRKHHPDAGGKTADMQAVNEAASWLRHLAQDGVRR